MHDFYLYAVNSNGKIDNIDSSVDHLGRILNSGYILNRKTLGMTGAGFNGTEYISLSDYDKRFNNAYMHDDVFFDYTAFTLYSSKAVSIMVAKDMVKAKELRLIRPIESSFLSLAAFYTSALDIVHGLMTDLPDEVQVKGNIKSETFRGITIPSLEIARNYDVSKVIEIYRKIKELLVKYEYQLSIFDLNSLEKINSDDDVSRIVKRSL